MMNTFKTLLPFIRRLWPHFFHVLMGILAGVAALMAAVGLLALAGWFLTATALAGLTAGTAQAFNFFFPGIGLRLFAFTRIAARYGERVLAHDATLRILKTLRVWFYERLEPLAPAGLARYRSGDMLNRLVADIDTLDQLYIRVLGPVVAALVMVGGLGVFLSLFDRILAVTAGGVLLGAVVLVPGGASVAALNTGRRLTTATGRLRTTIVDGLQGLTDLIVCGAIPAHLKQLAQQQQDLLRLQRRLSHIRGLSSALITLLAGAAVWAGLYIGIILVETGALPGAFLACLVLGIWAAFEAAFPLAHAFQHLGRIHQAAERILEVTRQTPAVVFPEVSAGPLPHVAIDLCRVCFRYHSDAPPVLSNLNLHLAQGSRIALAGATGCGKSTLVHLLTRVWNPDSGDIRIGGRRLQDLTEDELRRTITVISQQSHIFNGSLAHNLRVARPEATAPEMQQALEAAQLADFLQSLPKGLNTWVGEKGQRLSGGQARRLALARAVLHNAPIWILDEPTEGLDQFTATAVTRSLLQCAANRTVLFITHRQADIEVMDQVVVMSQGRIFLSADYADFRRFIP